MAKPDLVSYFKNNRFTAISRSAMSSILKNKSNWLAVDSNTASKMSEHRCANKMLEDLLHLWFITNVPSGKSGDINGNIIKEMAEDLANDPQKIARLIAQYPHKLVYNMDETAKRHNLTPS